VGPDEESRVEGESLLYRTCISSHGIVSSLRPALPWDRSRGTSAQKVKSLFWGRAVSALLGKRDMR
jgi:hypothetical protein